ncbi:DUF2264 domain-containing protein [Nonomuraea sp. NN258]|uniref:DUF2264 domain-containing protein n=1 Tax=Nonomuraea antri TaxID=2730852 RepID=UPI001569631B|nr:DUF2264 domain-containing protein [Nonomuraea antri]NRQ35228.1 DUF2264 domain-containing protein [Nonomuraea antri]
MFPLPPEDRSLSPHTGWTRAHWEAAADGLLAAVEPYRSADGAVITLPGRESWSRCDGLEGFARTFLLAAFRVAGGGPPELLEPYARGFRSGPDVWQPITDRTQPMVEAASMALGLWLTRAHLWDRLTATDQERLAGYLAGALRHEPVDNNWWLFPAMAGGFLSAIRRHRKDADAAVERGLARIEAWYTGDGWYSDGDNRSFDHYNGWAMHLYPALLGHLSGTAGPRYRDRLREFLAGYARTFDAGGGMLYHGRSVTYRFASAAALFTGALVDATPLTPGQTRCVASGVLRHFLDRGGALSAEGLLTLGWYGPHEPSLQPYSGSASPYWAAKGFVGLLLPADHPVWTSVEEPGPTGVAALPGPGLVVEHTGGLARLLNHGSQHHPGDPLYDRYAYSTRTGPTADGDVPDNHFGVVQADGTLPERGVIVPRGAGTLDGDVAWAASASDGVASLSVLRNGVEVRAHRVAPGSNVRQTGWALPGTAEPGAAVTIRADDGLISHLTARHGYTGATIVEAGQGTAFGGPALVPVLDGVAEDGWAVSIAVLADEIGPLPTVEIAEDVTVTWPDGLTHTFAVPITVP